MKSGLEEILAFINKAEKLKLEMRHSWLSNNRQESVAEHSWRMSLMAILLKDKLKVKVDIARVLKMIIIHDLVEIEAGDVSALDILRDPSIKQAKQQNEILAIENIKEELGDDLGNEIYELWHEFEDKETQESRFANALDKLEVQIQHNHASLETWEEIEFRMVYMMDQHVSFDEKLTEFKNLVVSQAEHKMKKNNISPDKYRSEVEKN